jgi:hypothetical protein
VGRDRTSDGGAVLVRRRRFPDRVEEPTMTPQARDD